MQPVPIDQAQAPPPPGGLLVCPRHGLRYDPRRSTGCVRCRRTTDEAVDRRAGPLAVVGLLIGGLIAVGVGVSAYRAYRSPDVAAAGDAALSPAQRRCLGAAAAGLAGAVSDCVEGCAQGGAACRRLAGLCAPGAEVAAASGCEPGVEGLLDRACQTGDQAACVLRSEQRRAAVLATACEGGLGAPCRELAGLCEPQRAALADGAPATAWAFLGSLRAACAGGPARLIERGCRQGDWQACDLPGAREPLPAGRLAQLLDAACDRRDAAACRRLVSELPGEPGAAAALAAQAAAIEACAGSDTCPVGRWRDRLGSERPRVEQQSALSEEQGCEQGRVSACWMAAEAYATGEGVRRDERRAAALGARARQLLAAGCGQPGGACASAGVLRSLEACDGGDGEACLAAMRQQSGGLVSDGAVLARRARRMLRQSCDARAGSACWALAGMARQGQAPLSDDQLTALLSQGCDGRSGLSCHALGLRLAEGRGAPVDRTGSERAFRQAAGLLEPPCAAGDQASCQALAQILREGRGVPRDEARAAQLDARAGAAAPAPSAPAAPRQP